MPSHWTLSIKGLDWGCLTPKWFLSVAVFAPLPQEMDQMRSTNFTHLLKVCDN